jgi:prolyl-tRNA editing enzyme YbaK/EbsC (Cys-tRNA(Pro) deacylase)
MKPHSVAPGLTLPTFELSQDVITCAEAAASKKIPIENELKTLVLKTSDGLRALHIRGDKQASFRKVKKHLDVQQASMASAEDLDLLGLLPGTVCPILEPVWNLRHLIDAKVLELEFVSTNNGTRSHYFRFSPQILLAADEVGIGDFDV